MGGRDDVCGFDQISIVTVLPGVDAYCYMIDMPLHVGS
jgi:hypothetical protein